MRTVHELKPKADPEKKKFKSFQEYGQMAQGAGLSVLGTNTGFAGNVHDPALTVGQLANAATVSLFDVSSLAPGDLKEKVLAFQQEVHTILSHYLKEAMRLEQLRIGLLLEAHGHTQAASLIKG